VDEQRVNVIAELVTVPRELGDHYRIGAHITVWDSAGVIMVPVSALIRTPTGWVTHVVRHGRLATRAVGVGHANSRDAEITHGLAEGDTIVAFPVEGLREGQAVRTQ
jgi:HlyD family secretion protein